MVQTWEGPQTPGWMESELSWVLGDALRPAGREAFFPVRDLAPSPWLLLLYSWKVK